MRGKRELVQNMAAVKKKGGVSTYELFTCFPQITKVSTSTEFFLLILTLR